MVDLFFLFFHSVNQIKFKKVNSLFKFKCKVNTTEGFVLDRRPPVRQPHLRQSCQQSDTPAANSPSCLLEFKNEKLNPSS